MIIPLSRPWNYRRLKDQILKQQAVITRQKDKLRELKQGTAPTRSRSAREVKKIKREFAQISMERARHLAALEEDDQGEAAEGTEGGADPVRDEGLAAGTARPAAATAALSAMLPQHAGARTPALKATPGERPAGVPPPPPARHGSTPLPTLALPSGMPSRVSDPSDWILPTRSRLWAWGGGPVPPGRLLPSPVPLGQLSARRLVSVAAAGHRAALLTETGDVYVWEQPLSAPSGMALRDAADRMRVSRPDLDIAPAASLASPPSALRSAPRGRSAPDGRATSPSTIVRLASLTSRWVLDHRPAADPLLDPVSRGGSGAPASPALSTGSRPASSSSVGRLLGPREAGRIRHSASARSTGGGSRRNSTPQAPHGQSVAEDPRLHSRAADSSIGRLHDSIHAASERLVELLRTAGRRPRVSSAAGVSQASLSAASESLRAALYSARAAGRSLRVASTTLSRALTGAPSREDVARGAALSTPAPRQLDGVDAPPSQAETAHRCTLARVTARAVVAAVLSAQQLLEDCGVELGTTGPGSPLTPSRFATPPRSLPESLPAPALSPLSVGRRPDTPVRPRSLLGASAAREGALPASAGMPKAAGLAAAVAAADADASAAHGSLPPSSSLGMPSPSRSVHGVLLDLHRRVGPTDDDRRAAEDAWSPGGCAVRALSHLQAAAAHGEAAGAALCRSVWALRQTVRRARRAPALHLVRALLLHRAVRGAAGRVVQVAVGERHCLARTASGEVFSWGSGSRGQLGHGRPQDEHAPRLIASMLRNRARASWVACGPRHSAAVTTDGAAWVWGSGKMGKLGLGDSAQQNAPVRMAHTGGGETDPWRRGYTTAPARTPAGAPSASTSPGAGGGGGSPSAASAAAGPGAGGVLGWMFGRQRSETEEEEAPGLDPQERPWAAGVLVWRIECGAAHTVAVSRSGDVFAWGFSEAGQLGCGELGRGKFSRPRRVPMPATGSTSSASSGRADRGASVASGAEADAAGPRGSSPPPAAMRLARAARSSSSAALRWSEWRPGKGVVGLACGMDHTVVVSVDGRCFAWGSDDHGQVSGRGLDAGQPDGARGMAAATVHRRVFSPAELPVGPLFRGLGARAAPAVMSVAAGDFHSLAATDTGAVVSWGRNDRGQLGEGVSVDPAAAEARSAEGDDDDEDDEDDDELREDDDAFAPRPPTRPACCVVHLPGGATSWRVPAGGRSAEHAAAWSAALAASAPSGFVPSPRLRGQSAASAPRSPLSPAAAAASPGTRSPGGTRSPSGRSRRPSLLDHPTDGARVRAAAVNMGAHRLAGRRSILLAACRDVSFVLDGPVPASGYRPEGHRGGRHASGGGRCLLDESSSALDAADARQGDAPAAWEACCRATLTQGERERSAELVLRLGRPENIVNALRPAIAPNDEAGTPGIPAGELRAMLATVGGFPSSARRALWPSLVGNRANVTPELYREAVRRGRALVAAFLRSSVHGNIERMRGKAERIVVGSRATPLFAPGGDRSASPSGRLAQRRQRRRSGSGSDHASAISDPDAAPAAPAPATAGTSVPARPAMSPRLHSPAGPGSAGRSLDRDRLTALGDRTGVVTTPSGLAGGPPMTSSAGPAPPGPTPPLLRVPSNPGGFLRGVHVRSHTAEGSPLLRSVASLGSIPSARNTRPADSRHASHAPAAAASASASARDMRTPGHQWQGHAGDDDPPATAPLGAWAEAFLVGSDDPTAAEVDAAAALDAYFDGSAEGGGATGGGSLSFLFGEHDDDDDGADEGVGAPGTPGQPGWRAPAAAGFTSRMDPAEAAGALATLSGPLAGPAATAAAGPSSDERRRIADVATVLVDLKRTMGALRLFDCGGPLRRELSEVVAALLGVLVDMGYGQAMPWQLTPLLLHTGSPFLAFQVYLNILQRPEMRILFRGSERGTGGADSRLKQLTQRLGGICLRAVADRGLPHYDDDGGLHVTHWLSAFFSKQLPLDQVADAIDFYLATGARGLVALVVACHELLAPLLLRRSRDRVRTGASTADDVTGPSARGVVSDVLHEALFAHDGAQEIWKEAVGSERVVRVASRRLETLPWDLVAELDAFLGDPFLFSPTARPRGLGPLETAPFPGYTSEPDPAAVIAQMRGSVQSVQSTRSMLAEAVAGSFESAKIGFRLGSVNEAGPDATSPMSAPSMPQGPAPPQMYQDF